MAIRLAAALAVALCLAAVVAEGKTQRKLGYYQGGGGGGESGSSPVEQTPSSGYGSTPSGSSPVDQTPSSGYGSTPSGSSPVDQTPSSGYGSTPSGSSPVDQTPSSGYGSTPSGSSPVDQTPSGSYGSTPSGSSPVDQTPSGSYGSTPSGSSPVDQTPSSSYGSTPSGASPVYIPPVTASPTGGYAGYGARRGCGSSRYWSSNPGRAPRVLSLVSSLARFFGPKLLKVFSHPHPTSLFGALKDESPEPMNSLAREASASLINAMAYNDFPLRSEDVVGKFNAALDSPQLANAQALQFQQLNEAL